MKILASGDHHFDEHSRFAECIRVHEGMVQTAHKQGIDLFLSGGDVYERASTPTERKAAAGFMIAMAEACPVVITQGNHDRPRDLELLSKLKTKHPVTVIEDAQLVRVAGASVMGVAWPDRASILKAALLSDESGDDVAKTALRNVFAGLASEADAHTGPRIALGHFMVDGAVMSNGQPLLGQPINVGLQDLELFRAHFGSMAHIHRAARYDVGGAAFFFTGSPFRTDFGQLERKTILLAEFDGETLVRTEEIDSGATPMIHLDGSWSESDKTLHFEWAEEQVAGAEVRARYDVPRDQMSIAWTLAQDYKREMRSCGAVVVKVEPVPMVVNRAKAPQVAKARDVGAKIVAHWESIGFEPGERREPIISKARGLEEAVGVSKSVATSVQLHSFECQAMGPHAGKFGFDLDRYETGAVVAFVAPNGYGKTFTLETAVAGACYRKMPTQDTLVRRALARNSYVQSVISSGDKKVTIRHELDAVSGKGETLVLGEDGQPVYSGTKVSSFDKWAARFLPDPAVLFATQFSAQPQGKTRPHFIDLDSAERISVLLKTIGVERIEVMAQMARKHRDEAELELEKVTARLNDERERVGDVDALSREAKEAAELVEALKLDHARLQNELTEAESAAAKVAQESAVLAEKKAQHTKRTDEVAGLLRRLKAEDGAAGASVERNESRLVNANAMISKAAEIQAAVDEERSAREAFAQVAEESSALAKVVAEMKSSVAVLEERLSQASAKLKDATARLSERELVQEAVESLERLRAKLDAALVARDAAEKLVESTDGAIVAGVEDRLLCARGALGKVTTSEGHEEAKELAAQGLEHDDQLKTDAIEAPKRRRAVKESLMTARSDLEMVRREFDEADRLAAKATALAAAEKEQAATMTLRAELSWKLSVEQENLDTALVRQSECSERLTKADQEIAKWGALASKREALEVAKAVAGEIAPQIESAKSRQVELAVELKAAESEARELRLALLDFAELPNVPDVAALKITLSVATEKLAEQQSASAVASSKLDTAKSQQAKLSDICHCRDKAAAELADWVRLSLDLGRGGIQSAEVDSAGPELTDLCNELLRASHGSRFTFSVDTTRLSADGKRQIDEFVLNVIDTERGREADAQSFSGGERVFLGEVIENALLMLGCYRADAQSPTLVRDESGAALDPENTRAYFKMLKYVAKSLNAVLLLVTHSPELQEMADDRIKIGRPVEVEERAAEQAAE